ncbi:39S ribosomal protein S30, mitochondrial-like [Gigantopelta aegis]|uniref:39S ribosomal protein S30, mitochondrial-like n=1 Tax=Gigantopelta aegis TaxID=1735272 RepID=UPI001B88D565|nr:39S ribosomal protein S30, mitochondrial-like [Gigantopelta aegis]
MAASMCRRSKQIGRYVQNALLCVSRNSSSLQVQLEENTEVEYPPVKPKFPPGKWGDMDRKYAWHWHDETTKIAEITDPKQRMDELTSKEMKMWLFKVPEVYPRQLLFQQYATKTHMVEGLPDIYTSLETDLLVNKIKELLIEYICLEQDKILRNVYLSKFSSWIQSHQRSRIIVDAINRSILQMTSDGCDHLANCQIGEGVRVSAFWDRHGIERNRRVMHPTKTTYVTVQDSRFQAKYVADFQIRVEQPLPEFVPVDDPLCSSVDGPNLKYHPTVIGQVQMRKEKPSVVAGHWLGDPCEFGQLSMLLTNQIQQQVDYHQYSKQYELEFEKNLGLSASFVWLVAQAHTQGFNTYLDLTYPLTTQTILTDGQHFTFFAYQLNTLHLWKSNDANPTRNVCWHTDQMKLYDVVEDGTVKGFNDDVLRNIVKMFVLKPRAREVNLRPTLPAGDSRLIEQTKYLSEKQEEIVEEVEETYV